MNGKGLGLFARYLADRLRRRLTWVTALVVGTLINAYGQLLVPWLRNIDDPGDVFLMHVKEHPGEAILSILVAYLFPFCVSATAAAIARYEDRAVHSRALFPDQKPDPVFRARPDGSIVDAGEPTRRLFERHGVQRAQDVLGDEVWARVIATTAAGNAGTLCETIDTPRIPGRFLVRHAVLPSGEINLYLALVHRDDEAEAMPFAPALSSVPTA